VWPDELCGCIDAAPPLALRRDDHQTRPAGPAPTATAQPLRVHLYAALQIRPVNNSRERFRFQFDGVLLPDAKQDEVFERTARPLVGAALEGWVPRGGGPGYWCQPSRHPLTSRRSQPVAVVEQQRHLNLCTAGARAARLLGPHLSTSEASRNTVLLSTLNPRAWRTRDP
jgi:hypothetical protein